MEGEHEQPRHLCTLDLPEVVLLVLLTFYTGCLIHRDRHRLCPRGISRTEKSFYFETAIIHPGG